MREKIYLQPRRSFDECISQETADYITYNAQNIIALLANQFADEDEVKLDEIDYLYMAEEWFDYSIKPLEEKYNLLFTFTPGVSNHV